MNFVDAVAKSGDIPAISPASTSYFSAPSMDLDQKLFDPEERLKVSIREPILTLLFNYLDSKFSNAHTWTRAWLAGSGVSYQWEASRQPGDLDCLVGIDYVKFRESNQSYAGYSDAEIAKTINEGFHEQLMPKTANWNGYELTFYVNEQSDIRDINPYAAYDLILDDWTVRPEKVPHPPKNSIWEQKANRDYEMGSELVGRYSSALQEARAATNPAHRVNAESKIKHAAEQASAFYEDIHHGRKIAFSRIGAGYSDYNNYRWQAGKKTGVIQALKTIKDQKDAAESASQVQTYGVELPDTSTLIRRSLRG